MIFEEAQILRGRRSIVRLADIFCILAMVFIILVVFRNYAAYGELVQDYLLPGDSMGHVYKVEMTKKILLEDRALVDWDDGWYSGYHPFHSYSPLGYVPYVIISIFLSDVGVAFRIGIILGFVLAALAMYFLVLTLLQDRAEQLCVKLAAAGAALFFSLNPYNIGFIVGGGELPSLYSIAMMPVSLVLLFKLLRKGSVKMSVGYALATAITFLAHAHFGLLAAMGGLLLFVTSMIARFLQSTRMTVDGFSTSSVAKKQILRIMAAYVFSIILLAGLVAFWALPYFIEAPVLSDVTAYAWVLRQKSIGYLDIVIRPEMALWGARYVGALAIIIMPLGFLDRKSWRDLGGFFLTFFIVWLLALGTKTPAYSLLPFGNLFFPERAIGLLVLVTGCVLAYSLLAIVKRIDRVLSFRKFNSVVRRGLSYGVAILLMVLVMFDISIGFAKAVGLSSGNPEFVKIGDLVQSIDGEMEGARTLYVGPEYVLYSYSPILSGRPYADGYYAQGSKSSYVIEYCRTSGIERNETKFFLGRYVDFDVKYVVVDITDDVMLNNLLRTGQFQLINRSGKYTLLQFLGRKGFIIEGRPDILVVGIDDYTSELAKSVLDVFAQNFTVTKGQYTYIDDYTLSDLKGHDAAVIYGIKFHDMSAAEKLLSQYVEEGGFLIIDADSSSDPAGRFMGVDYHLFTPSSASTVTYSKFNLTSEVNSSLWSGAVYEGLDDPLLIMSEGKTVIGRKDGVVFLGGNLFYNTDVTAEPAQISLLEQLIDMGLKTDGGRRVDYEAVEKTPDHKEYTIRLDSDSMVRLSMTTSPYWRVYVDGVPSKIIDQDGFVRLFVRAGEHTITFQYADTPVKTASNAITAASLALCALIYVYAWKKKTSVKYDSS